jgi:hypothetical protein
MTYEPPHPPEQPGDNPGGPPPAPQGPWGRPPQPQPSPWDAPGAQPPPYQPPAYQQPGGYPPPGGAAYGPPPNNYLVGAILTTLFCCLPAGVVAIVYAAQVNSKWNAGDVAGAQQSAKNAKTWTWVSFGVGLVVALLYIAALVATAGSTDSTYNSP